MARLGNLPGFVFRPGRLRALASAAGLALALSLAAAPSRQAMAESVTLEPGEARAAAIHSLNGGNPALADGLIDALLVRDPDDVELLILKTRSATALGRHDEAAAAGRHAWRVAKTDPGRYAAAVATARALQAGGRGTLAQFWLRRATDIAPDRTARALAVKEFRFVRARNPWAAELQFSLTPTNNVNNGSARSTTRLYGLPFDFQLDGAAQALSGLEASAGVALRYRFAQSGTHASDVVLQLNHRTYALSDDAKAQAPGVSGSDFAFSHAALGYLYQGRPESGGSYSLGATAGQSWYGGEAYYSYLRLNGSRSLAFGDAARLGLSGSVERQFGAMSADTDVFRTDLRYARKTGDAGTLGLSLGHSSSWSAAEVAEYSEIRGGVDFSLARPVFGAQVTFGLQARLRDYPRSRHDPSGRVDEEIEASVDLVFTAIERFGFNPTLSVEAVHTDSNIGLYDRNRVGLRLGLQSAF